MEDTTATPSESSLIPDPETIYAHGLRETDFAFRSLKHAEHLLPVTLGAEITHGLYIMLLSCVNTDAKQIDWERMTRFREYLREQSEMACNLRDTMQEQARQANRPRPRNGLRLISVSQE